MYYWYSTGAFLVFPYLLALTRLFVNTGALLVLILILFDCSLIGDYVLIIILWLFPISLFLIVLFLLPWFFLLFIVIFIAYSYSLILAFCIGPNFLVISYFLSTFYFYWFVFLFAYNLFLILLIYSLFFVLITPCFVSYLFLDCSLFLV